MKNYKEIKEEIKNDKIKNFKERIWFIKYWANFIRTHSDKEWSRGQAILINSQLQSTRDFYKEQEKIRNLKNENNI